MDPASSGLAGSWRCLQHCGYLGTRNLPAIGLVNYPFVSAAGPAAWGADRLAAHPKLVDGEQRRMDRFGLVDALCFHIDAAGADAQR